ncbi:MAG: RDD family protein, partial [Alphaproteobacteria bacterium]
MTESWTGRQEGRGGPGGPGAQTIRPHAYDPVTQPEYFDGVLGRRIIAFFIDLAIIAAMWTATCVVLFILGIFTFGLAWLLFGVAFPVVALGYYAWTLSQEPSATIGMRLMGLQMRTWYGERMYALLGAFHAILFYFTIALLTPFVLLIA